ncbi:MAG: NAD(P)H-dependent oxidoreductase [Pseudomonadota bacterium]
MPNLLPIDSSSRRAGSQGRALADIVGARRRRSGGTVTTRDATALSDALIAELQATETLLISTPIYSFAPPAALKLWIDQIVHIDRKFAFDGATFKGLAARGRAVLCLADGAGGCGPGGAMQAADFLAPYLRFLMTFLGIDNVRTVAVERATAHETTLSTNLAAARDAARAAA